jgi:transcription-repair coupling factor (superfamily II helicase)
VASIAPHRTTPLTPPLPAGNTRYVLWQRLYGSSLGLAIARAAETAGLVVAVAADARGVQRLESQVRFYGNTAQVPLFPFPDWECLPYDNFSPHQDIISQRLLTLHRLPRLHAGIVIVPVGSLMQRLVPAEFVEGRSFTLSVGDSLDIARLRDRLQSVGYQAVSQVLTPGEYSVRGGLIDIFPMGQKTPIRLDLFGDEIESIRYFDPESQRSVDKVERLQLLPAREFPTDEPGIRHFRQSFRSRFEGDPQKSSVYRNVSAGVTPAGIEFYLPLFFEHTETFFDYLPPKTLFILDDGCGVAMDRVFAETRDRFELAGANSDNPVLPPDALYLDPKQAIANLERFPRVQVSALASAEVGKIGVATFNSRSLPDLAVNTKAESPYESLIGFIRQNPGRTLLVAETTGHREVLQGVLREHGISANILTSWSSFESGSERLGLCVAELEQGMRIETPDLTVITESQLYGERVFQRRRRSAAGRDPEAIIKSLAELNVGDPIVHEDHGVGRYRGLKILSVDDSEGEFLTIEYQDGDKLYIPVLSLDMVSRYVGAHPEAAPLHKLGSEQWLRAKQRAKDKAYDVATELLEIQALRGARSGHSFPAPDETFAAFAADFPFEETPDQDQVIHDVLTDMASDKPMDRLVCGDVGFGKTEIALRAAFLAVNGGAQVAILVPTTLLAQQHFETFRDRFADFPVTVELLSRFRTSTQIENALSGLSSGKVDIIIGTHRLLQSDVKFRHLGLLIIDEEHRFGVRQKERLKRLRSQVDILTLTATPIPRTLNGALSGLRDISIIATPPRARLSIKTFIRERNPAVIREACLRETRRGGQIYYLHNEVRTIDKLHSELQALLPEIEIHTAHGQMPERQLEAIMRDFYHQRFSLLLCTTIIESGIDVPTANTIIINRADRFGLAQLHQLRGRVGRSHHQAYAYLLVPPRGALAGDALKRLQAIESLEDLGAGFALASHDLEIRGAGELLGEAQSGMIDEIGFTMYTDFLNRAIASIKAQREGGATTETSRPRAEIDLHVPALLPESYLPDVHQRLVMYKRITNAASTAELQEIQAETVDRFGLLPDATRTLFRLAEMRLAAAPLGIERIDLAHKGGRIFFAEGADIDPLIVIRLIELLPERYRMQGPQTLLLRQDMPDAESRLTVLRQLLSDLSGSGANSGNSTFSKPN